MSSDTKPSPRPATSGVLNAGVYASVAVVSAFAIGIHLLNYGYVLAAFVLAVLVVLVLVVRLWLVGPVVFLVLLFLLMEDPRMRAGARALELDGIVLAFATLAFVVSGSRYVALTSGIIPYPTVSLTGTVRENFRSFIRTVSLFAGGADVRDPDAVDSVARLEARSSSTIRPEEFASGTFRVLIPLLLAMGILLFVPPYADSAREVGLVPQALRASSIAWLIVGVAAVVLLALRVCFRKAMTPREAGVFLRCVLTVWCHRDMGSMVRRQVRHRRKSVVTNAGRGKGRRAKRLNNSGGTAN